METAAEHKENLNLADLVLQKSCTADWYLINVPHFSINKWGTVPGILVVEVISVIAILEMLVSVFFFLWGS